MDVVAVAKRHKNSIQNTYIFWLVFLFVLLESFLYPFAAADSASAVSACAGTFSETAGTASLVTALPKMQKADVPEVIGHAALRAPVVHVIYTGNTKSKQVIGRFYGGLLLLCTAVFVRTLTAVILSVFFRKKEYLLKILTVIHKLDGKKRSF